MATKTIDCDVVIAGCGVAGLYCALNLPRALNVVLLSKEDVASCDSMLAQGGICVLHDPDDYESFFEDTLRAGHYENRLESVDMMIRASRPIIDDLIKRGVRFARTATGELDYTREGAHSRPRIVYHEDITGEEITTHLLACVRELPNARVMENTCMTDVIEGFDGAGRRVCRGIVAEDAAGDRLVFNADATVMATGGVGGLYKHSTNFPCLTGDGCRIAAEHGVLLEHMDYVQIHPTTLWTNKSGRSFLISESARATAPFVTKVEVECESLDMVREAVDAGADIIMLDNMTHDAMAEAIALIGGRAITEASGNVTAQNAAEYADLGVDIVSCGALTHSAGILDLSLKHLEVLG